MGERERAVLNSVHNRQTRQRCCNSVEPALGSDLQSQSASGPLQVKDALSGTGIDFEEIELSGQLKLLESIKKTTGRTTVPQVALLSPPHVTRHCNRHAHAGAAGACTQCLPRPWSV